MQKSQLCGWSHEVHRKALRGMVLHWSIIPEFFISATKHSHTEKEKRENNQLEYLQRITEKKLTRAALEKSYDLSYIFRQYFPNIDKLSRGIWLAPSGQRVLSGYCGEQHMHSALRTVSYSVKKALETVLKPALKNPPYV